MVRHRFAAGIAITIAAAVAIVLATTVALQAQRGGGRGGRQAGPPVTARAGAAVDLTGYWVSVVSEGWQFRMLTPPKGNYTAVPLTAAARRQADAWDPAKDAAAGEQCKGYGAAAIMQVPGRLHVTWVDDNTLRMDTDAGTQTRLFHFDGQAPKPAEPTWQGYSAARWEYATGQRGSTPAAERTGVLRVTTTGMRPGYLRRNGVPYSAEATVDERYQLLTAPNGDQWLIVTTIVEDAANLTTPFITSTNFKKIPGAAGWNPTPCSAD
jgi:hypothetical protein